MLAKRKLNNNAVLCIDSAGSEIIAMGKGVGFGTLPREITPAEVERTFYNISPADQNVMRDLPAEVVLFAAKIIDIADNELPYPLSSNAPLLLADHINFAMERVRKRLHVRMPLAYDVQQMYPMEYKIGLYTVDRIRKDFQIGLPKEEAVGIAMNLLSAKAEPADQSEQDEAARFDEMLEEITEIVENDFHQIIDRDSFNYSRYATHVQYLFKRIRNQKSIDSENIRMYRSLREEFPAIAECVTHIRDHLNEKWGFELSEEEQLYLMLHVNRICVKEGL
mgnify:CR=1 FL=1